MAKTCARAFKSMLLGQFDLWNTQISGQGPDLQITGRTAYASPSNNVGGRTKKWRYVLLFDHASSSAKTLRHVDLAIIQVG